MGRNKRPRRRRREITAAEYRARKDASVEKKKRRQEEMVKKMEEETRKHKEAYEAYQKAERERRARKERRPVCWEEYLPDPDCMTDEDREDWDWRCGPELPIVDTSDEEGQKNLRYVLCVLFSLSFFRKYLNDPPL